MTTAHNELFAGSQFFAPANTDMVDGLIGQYKKQKSDIEAVAKFIFGGDNQVAIAYFLNGNRDRERHVRDVATIFKIEGAIAQLNADYWQKAMLLTDVYDYMPAARRDEWDQQIFERQTPEFEEDAVRATMTGLLNNRHQYFGERVDGIFRSLSGCHITNRPEGFSKRMIIWSDLHKGEINDLRQVVAKLMGRSDQPNYNSTVQMLEAADRNTGQWMLVDGGVMRIRTYLKGTAHFEVNPSIAWQLNQVLASLHPTAIPSEFRQPPERKVKNFMVVDQPLPFSVINALAQMSRPRTTPWIASFGKEPVQPVTTNRNSLVMPYIDSKVIKAEVHNVIVAIGGVELTSDGGRWYEFDYDPTTVIDHIVTSGCVPNDKSYQFYPTPSELAVIAVDLAEIKDTDYCLEPSAGLGGLADYMPKDQTLCVELSALRCKALESKGFKTIKADFLELEVDQLFDKVVMNPPFSEGRWQAHVEYASRILDQGGRLVAILPASAKNNFEIKGFDCEWSSVYSNLFKGTATNVVILVARHKKEDEQC